VFVCVSKPCSGLTGAEWAALGPPMCGCVCIHVCVCVCAVVNGGRGRRGG
jgi:hypothetical protein